ncbi:MAG TPA: hypothetical protein VFW45_11680 [Candidatus Polarisedimenticolia bacterium]|nr:hypothetical protein [Candidatus Polarisedimenticolia bacterium]
MKKPVVVASILLGVVSLAHLLRVVFQVQVTVADRVIPMWVSWVAFLVSGGMAVVLWREAHNHR